MEPKIFITLHHYGEKDETLGWRHITVTDFNKKIEFLIDPETIMAFEDGQITDYNGTTYECCETRAEILKILQEITGCLVKGKK